MADNWNQKDGRAGGPGFQFDSGNANLGITLRGCHTGIPIAKLGFLPGIGFMSCHLIQR